MDKKKEIDKLQDVLICNLNELIEYTDSMKAELEEYTDKIWELKNPPKYKIGDRVNEPVVDADDLEAVITNVEKVVDDGEDCWYYTYVNINSGRMYRTKNKLL